MLTLAAAILTSIQSPTSALDLTTGQQLATAIPIQNANNPILKDTISADSQSLMVNGKRVMWAMGEFHYSRYPESEWRQELQKMKAGGINVISSYIIWIHHEEVQGQSKWDGNKDLRKFLLLCKDLGLKAIVRGGPWVHAEVRNGGFPDWITNSFNLRSEDPAYLAEVKKFYEQISKQMSGLSWKDGGPVIGFQVENEYYGPGEYLLNLKRMAQEVGIVVPLYTRTGWPMLKTPVPANELFPMYGAYPIGFWDRGIEETAAKYGKNYTLTLNRNPDDILQGATPKPEVIEAENKYPHMCCEIGGGMHVSYHRRVVVEPNDIGSLALAKVASGNNLQGYYMYHGGTNPEGNTYLSESQSTGYWNDVPVKSYDFQAPLGEFGQIRPHYHILRRMHLFMRDFGSQLAGMKAQIGSPDIANWSVRSNGESGYIFVNNYMRLTPQPARKGVQFSLKCKSGSLVVPSKPIDVPANSYFYWPFHQDLSGAQLTYATAQPICKLKDAYFFAQTKGVPAEFVFPNSDSKVLNTTGKIVTSAGFVRLTNLKSGLEPAITLQRKDGKLVTIYLLSESQSLHIWKGSFASIEAVVVSDDDVLFDRNELVLTSRPSTSKSVAVMPAMGPIKIAGVPTIPSRAGEFSVYHYANSVPNSIVVPISQTAVMGSARDIYEGSQAVSEQPSDENFEAASKWDIKLPNSLPPGNWILKIRYQGDAARLYLNGKLIEDNFYNGKPLELGLSRYGAAILRGGLTLSILPLRKDAQIYMTPGMWPNFGQNSGACSVISTELVGTASVVAKSN